jgi:hypothetical protein
MADKESLAQRYRAYYMHQEPVEDVEEGDITEDET